MGSIISDPSAALSGIFLSISGTVSLLTGSDSSVPITTVSSPKGVFLRRFGGM